MGAVNDLRLVIGTNLDVCEDDGPLDPDDPDAPACAVYGYLTGLLDDIVSALADGLSEPDPEAEARFEGQAPLLVSRPYPQRGANPGLRHGVPSPHRLAA